MFLAGKISLSLIGKLLVLNILGLSKLLFVSSVLTTPRWVCDRVNQIIWPFLWGSRIETVARRSLICSVPDGGLGLRDFRSHGQASCLAILVRTIGNAQSKGFFLLKYFCGAQLASVQRNWAHLRDNATPSALAPSSFYSPLLAVLRDLDFPAGFSFSSKEFYSLILAKIVSIPIYLYNGLLSFPGSFLWLLTGSESVITLLRTLRTIWRGSLRFARLRCAIPYAIGDTSLPIAALPALGWKQRITASYTAGGLRLCGPTLFLYYLLF